MKKVFLFTTSLIAVLLTGVIFMGANVYSHRDDVSFKEISHMGDHSFLEGLTLETNAALDDRLLWNSTTLMGEEPETQSDFKFYYTRQHENWPRTYMGIYTVPTMIFQVARIDADSLVPEYFPKEMKAFEEMWESVKPGEEKVFEVKLSDLMDYYPFGNVSDLPGLFSMEHAMFMLENGSVGEDDRELETMQELARQFKIPMLPTERVRYTIEKYKDGGQGIGVDPSGDFEAFNCTSFTDYTDTDIYFIFDAHTNRGNLVDLSLLTHGYGIYKMPYYPDEYPDGTEVPFEGPDASKLERIMERNPNQKPFDLKIDGDNLLLAYMDEGKTFIDVIDIKTGRVKDTIPLNEDVRYMDMEVNDGFTVLNISLNNADSEDVWNMEDRRIGVLEKKDDSYFVSFISERYKEGLEKYEDWSDSSYAYDGERLIKTGNIRITYDRPDGMTYETYDASDLVIKVFTKDGPQFAGKYQCSLTTGFSEDNQYRYQVHSFYPNVKASIK